MNLERITKVESTSHRFTVGQNNNLKNGNRDSISWFRPIFIGRDNAGYGNFRPRIEYTNWE